MLKTAKRLEGMAVGAVLVVETTDPLATLDIPAFCNEGRHRLLGVERIEGGHRFRIAKGTGPSAASAKA